MPIYEYQCPKCQNVFEEWLKASEMTDTYACPQCGGEAHHIMSHTSFVLKGGGWYVDDYGYRKGVSGDADAAGDAHKANSADAANAPVEDAAPAASATESKAAEAPAAAPAKQTPAAPAKAAAAKAAPQAKAPAA